MLFGVKLVHMDTTLKVMMEYAARMMKIKQGEMMDDDSVGGIMVMQGGRMF